MTQLKQHSVSLIMFLIAAGIVFKGTQFPASIFGFLFIGLIIYVTETVYYYDNKVQP